MRSLQKKVTPAAHWTTPKEAPARRKNFLRVTDFLPEQLMGILILPVALAIVPITLFNLYVVTTVFVLSGVAFILFERVKNETSAHPARAKGPGYNVPLYIALSITLLAVITCIIITLSSLFSVVISSAPSLVFVLISIFGVLAWALLPVLIGLWFASYFSKQLKGLRNVRKRLTAVLLGLSVVLLLASIVIIAFKSQDKHTQEYSAVKSQDNPTQQSNK